MKVKREASKLLALALACVCLLMLLSGCQQPPATDTATPAPTPAQTPTPENLAGGDDGYLFNCLHPAPQRDPIDVTSLSARLDTLDGKTLAVCANYNNGLYEFPEGLVLALKEQLPNTTVVYVSEMLVATGQATYPRSLDEPIENMTMAEFLADPQIADAVVVTNAF